MMSPNLPYISYIKDIDILMMILMKFMLVTRKRNNVMVNDNDSQKWRQEKKNLPTETTPLLRLPRPVSVDSGKCFTFETLWCFQGTIFACFEKYFVYVYANFFLCFYQFLLSTYSLVEETWQNHQLSDYPANEFHY